MNTRNRQKQELPRRAQEGDITAFAELFEEYRNLVFIIACRLAAPNNREYIMT